jgi:hypothetical protein
MSLNHQQRRYRSKKNRGLCARGSCTNVPRSGRTLCQECSDRENAKERLRYASSSSYRAKIQERNTLSRKLYPEKHRIRIAKYRKNNKARLENHRLIKTYGITLTEYNDLVVKQGGLCSLCGRKTRLVVDHNHKTGKIRGLLCVQCNLFIGFFKDDLGYLAQLCESVTSYMTQQSPIPSDRTDNKCDSIS